MSENFAKLPPDLPIPVDDGSGDRLLGKNLPDVVLISTSGKRVNISDLEGTVVFYLSELGLKPTPSGVL